jgi:hypothetical protein
MAVTNFNRVALVLGFTSVPGTYQSFDPAVAYYIANNFPKINSHWPKMLSPIAVPASLLTLNN